MSSESPPANDAALAQASERTAATIKELFAIYKKDPAAELEREFYARGKELDIENQGLENQNLRANIESRRKYALGFFILACVWILVITLVLLLQGFGSFWWGKMPFKLSDNVLLAAIGSTTANILGLVVIVANYLFPRHHQRSREKD